MRYIKGFIPVLVLLSLAIFGLVAYFGYSYLQPKDLASIKEYQTNDTKKYVSTKFNFQLSYPGDWSVKEAKTDTWSNEIGDDLSVLSLWPKENKSAGTPATENEVGLQIIKVKPGTNLMKWVRSRGDNDDIPNKYFTKLKINDYEAVKKDFIFTDEIRDLLYNGPSGPGAVGGRHVSVYIMKGDLIASFGAISTNNSQDFITKFDQILLTFKFTD